MTIQKTPYATAVHLPDAEPSESSSGALSVPARKLADGSHEVRTARGNICFGGQVSGSDSHRTLLSLTTPLGAVELRPVSSGDRWEVTFSDPKTADADPVSYALRFAEAHLELLAEAVHLLPEGLFEPQPLSSRSKAEQRFMGLVLPAIFLLPQHLQEVFGGLLACLTYEILYAIREEEALEAARGLKDRIDRLEEKFRTIPTGTVLIDRHGVPMIAVVSESRGRRRLTITMAGGRTFRRDIDCNAVEGLCLLSPARANEIDSRLLSAHQIIDALRGNRGLEERFPEWA